jgi:hypothetical protein
MATRCSTDQAERTRAYKQRVVLIHPVTEALAAPTSASAAAGTWWSAFRTLTGKRRRGLDAGADRDVCAVITELQGCTFVDTESDVP